MTATSQSLRRMPFEDSEDHLPELDSDEESDERRLLYGKNDGVKKMTIWEESVAYSGWVPSVYVLNMSFYHPGAQDHKNLVAVPLGFRVLPRRVAWALSVAGLALVVAVVLLVLRYGT